MLVIKFVFQFPFFCTCANRYSSGAQCPSSLTAYKDVCAARLYPHLDYYIDQPIVADYFIGVRSCNRQDDCVDVDTHRA